MSMVISIFVPHRASSYMIYIIISHSSKILEKYKKKNTKEKAKKNLDL
jgi:hypothetical protein